MSSNCPSEGSHYGFQIRSFMSREFPEAHPPLSAEEASAVAQLSSADVKCIDATILSCALTRWQKVAMVVSHAAKKLETKYSQLSDIYYAVRIQDMAARGRLESQGNLAYLRFSEVRLPAKR